MISLAVKTKTDKVMRKYFAYRCLGYVTNFFTNRYLRKIE